MNEICYTNKECLILAGMVELDQWNNYLHILIKNSDENKGMSHPMSKPSEKIHKKRLNFVLHYENGIVINWKSLLQNGLDFVNSNFVCWNCSSPSDIPEKHQTDIVCRTLVIRYYRLKMTRHKNHYITR